MVMEVGWGGVREYISGDNCAGSISDHPTAGVLAVLSVYKFFKLSSAV